MTGSEPTPARAAAERVFATSGRLPNDVVRDSSYRVVFFDAYWGLSEDFWEAARELAGAYGDESVYLSILDPSRELFYQRHYGATGELAFRVDASVAEFAEGVLHAPGGDLGGVIAYTADVYVWTGDQGSWGFWIERPKGLGLFAVRWQAWVGDWLSRHGPFVRPAQAAEELARPYLGGTVPAEFLSSLERNYAGRWPPIELLNDS